MSMGAVKQQKRREAREYADLQKGVTRCICGWSYKGRFGDGRRAFQFHRERRCRLTRAVA